MSFLGRRQAIPPHILNKPSSVSVTVTGAAPSTVTSASPVGTVAETTAFLAGSNAINTPASGHASIIIGTAIGSDETAAVPGPTDHLMVAVGADSNAITWSTPTDTQGGTYVLQRQTHGTAGNLYVFERTAGTQLGSGDEIDIHVSGTCQWSAACYSVPWRTANDKAPVMATGTGTIATTTASGTLAQATETVLTIISTLTNVTQSGGQPGVQISDTNLTSSPRICCYAVNTSATTSLTGSANLSGSDGWAADITTFEISFEIDVTVTGLTSDTASASPVGVVTTGVVGTTPSTVTSASPVGTVKIGVGTSPNTVTSASPVGTVTLVSNVSIAGVSPSTVTSASPVGAVTLISNVSVTGAAPNTVTSASPVGTVKIGVSGATPSTVTSTSPVGVVKIGVGTAPNTVTSASPVGTITLISNVSVSGATPNTVTSASPVGTVTLISNVSITGAVPNTVTSASPVGSVSTSVNASVTGAVPNTVTSASPVGTVTVAFSVSVTGHTPSTVTSASPAGIVNIGVVGSVPGSVTSASPVGHITIGVIGAAPNTVTSAFILGIVRTASPFGPFDWVGTAVDGNLLGGTATDTSALLGGASTDVNALLGGSADDDSLILTLGGTSTDTNLLGGSFTDVNALLGGAYADVSLISTLGGSYADANQLGGTATDVDALLGGSATDVNGLLGGLATDVNGLLGGSSDDVNAGLGGSTTEVSLVLTLGGSAIETNLLGGTSADVNAGLGGNYADANLLGGTLEYTLMQAVNLVLNEFNDETLDLTITNNSSAFDLTDYDINVYLKTAPGISDDDPSTVVLSTTGGSPAVTITNAADGLATVIIPNSDLEITTYGFWRVDVVNSDSQQSTAISGTVTVRPL